MPKISRDLDFLMTCFAEVLREQGEHAIAGALPGLDPDGRMADPEVTDRLTPACSTAFSLLNMVEENAYAQNDREMAKAGRLRERSGLWENTLRLLLVEGCTPADIASALPTDQVEPVLTAHPT
jgi:phosphoenolpyruvate carboxylase